MLGLGSGSDSGVGVGSISGFTTGSVSGTGVRSISGTVSRTFLVIGIFKLLFGSSSVSLKRFHRSVALRGGVVQELLCYARLRIAFRDSL